MGEIGVCLMVSLMACLLRGHSSHAGRLYMFLCWQAFTDNLRHMQFFDPLRKLKVEMGMGWEAWCSVQ